MKILKIIVVLNVLIFTNPFMAQETLAILPFTFTDDGHLSIEKGKEVQHFLIDYINKKSKHFNVTTINAEI